MPSLAQNIGPGGQRRRYLLGGVMLAVGVIAAAALLLGGAPRGWRLALLLPFWAAGLGFFQARDGT